MSSSSGTLREKISFEGRTLVCVRQKPLRTRCCVARIFEAQRLVQQCVGGEHMIEAIPGRNMLCCGYVTLAQIDFEGDTVAYDYDALTPLFGAGVVCALRGALE